MSRAVSEVVALPARRVFAMIAPSDAERESGMPTTRSTAAPPAAVRLVAAGLAVAVALSVAGCGRRGGLEFPPGSNPRENTVPANPDKPSGTRAPLEPFVLDPLL
jgi:predicted small lipoprotein YifL